MLVYLRDGPAQTIVRAATQIQTLEIKLSISPSHSILTPGQPGTWQGSLWSANFEFAGMSLPGKIPAQEGIAIAEGLQCGVPPLSDVSSALQGDTITERPLRWSQQEMWVLNAGWPSGKASTPRAADLGSIPASVWRGPFSRSSHASDLKIDTPVAILPGAGLAFLGQRRDWLNRCQFTVTGWERKFDMQLLSRWGSTFNCLRRSVPEIHMPVAETLSNNQPPPTIQHVWKHDCLRGVVAIPAEDQRQASQSPTASLAQWYSVLLVCRRPGDRSPLS